MDTMRVEIHFHQQDEASGFMQSTLIDTPPQLMELYFFSCFTATQLDDLRPNDAQAASSLAQALVSMELPIAPVDDDFKPFVAFILGTAPDTPRLVDYKGTPGAKMFGGELRYAGRTDFRLLRKGFGLLGRGRMYYVRHSVLHLLKYLARRRIQDADHLHYLWHLSYVASGCGKAFLNGNMGANNYLTEAMSIVSQSIQAYKILGPGWRLEAASRYGTTDRTKYLALLGDPTAQY